MVTRAYNPLTGEVRTFGPEQIIPSPWIALPAPAYDVPAIGTTLETPAPVYRVAVSYFNFVPWLILAVFVIGAAVIARRA